MDRYYVELEGYFFSQGVKSLLFFSLGAKYAYLLRSSHESFIIADGVRSILKDADFGGPAQFKFAVLLKINWHNIMLSKDLSIVPSYVFGYGISNDFMSNGRNTSSLNHRFEIGLFKNLQKK